MNSSKNITRNVSGPEFSSAPGYDGWTCVSDRIAVPVDYDSKKVISEDDILDLRIELNTKSSPEELYKSPVLFAQEYKTVFK